MNIPRLLTIIALTSISFVALAGYTQPATVEVDLDNAYAGGDTFTARNAQEDNVFIGCGVRNYDDGLGGIIKYGFCQAEDAEGDRILCSTFNPDLVEAMGAKSDYSFITFRWNEDFECVSAGSSTQSFYLPRK